MFDELIRRWWIVAARGIVAVAFGIATFLAPEQTLVMLVSLFGVFALLSLLFGGLVAVQSDASGAPFEWIIGGYAIVSGALLLALALNIRTWRQVPAIV
jgi:uncharacterized membrane protein HdeD (DUF308 family)